MIHCIGNSHAHFFTDSPSGAQNVWYKSPEKTFASYSIGPVIAYNFTIHHLNKVKTVLSALHNYDPETDYVMLVIGEVDCRWHLPLQVEKRDSDIETVVEECVDRFFQSILALKEEGYKMVGWGGHPTTTQGHNDHPHMPIYGDCEYRNKISRHWVKHLQKLCTDNDIPFVSLVEELIDENNLTKMKYYKDYCHIKTDPLIGMVKDKLVTAGISCT